MSGDEKMFVEDELTVFHEQFDVELPDSNVLQALDGQETLKLACFSFELPVPGTADDTVPAGLFNVSEITPDNSL